MTVINMVGDALIVDEYRYWLSRDWVSGIGEVNWIMLNPSTADAEVDDPTVRRCIAFSKAWGYRRLTVTNLWAYRATNPDDLFKAGDPVGPRNMEHVRRAIEESDLAVAAWGSTVVNLLKKGRTRLHPEYMLPKGRTLFSLGTTDGGQPRHPLYVRGDTEPEPYWVGA